ncbi:MAG: hypothetical protein ACFB03_15495 [Paracoccaceae bacterium]
MSKFLEVPASDDPQAASTLWAEPDFLDAVGVFFLAALATLFAALLVRGLLMKSGRRKGTPAAQSGDDYSGVGFGKSRKKRRGGEQDPTP